MVMSRWLKARVISCLCQIAICNLCTVASTLLSNFRHEIDVPLQFTLPMASALGLKQHRKPNRHSDALATGAAECAAGATQARSGAPIAAHVCNNICPGSLWLHRTSPA